MTSIPPRLYADLVGKPFVENGRGPDGYDCVGVGVAFQTRRGIHVPAYLSDEAELHRQLAAGGSLDELHRLPAAEPGCWVYLRSFDEGARHIGVMVDAYRMLHCWREVGVVVEVLHRSIWAKRVLGFYRPEVRA